MYHNLLMHLFAHGRLGCFHALAVANSAAMNTGVHVSLSVFISSGYMPRSGIAGSYAGFNFMAAITICSDLGAQKNKV